MRKCIVAKTKFNPRITISDVNFTSNSTTITRPIRLGLTAALLEPLATISVRRLPRHKNMGWFVGVGDNFNSV